MLRNLTSHFRNSVDYTIEFTLHCSVPYDSLVKVSVPVNKLNMILS